MIIGVNLTINRLNKLCLALNHPLKLEIIDLIFRKKEKSITDVRNELNISFSTAHKYLNLLEKAGILYYITNWKNSRLKKIYFLNAFTIEITPKIISEIVKLHITKHEEDVK